MAEAEGKTIYHGGDRSKAPKGLLIKEPDVHFGKLFGAGHNQVGAARALLRSDPDAAAQVKVGGALNRESRRRRRGAKRSSDAGSRRFYWF